MKRPFRWDKRYLYWGITAFLVIIGSIVFFLILSRLSVVWNVIRHIIGALSPILYGLIIAYLLNKLMIFFEERFFLRLGRRLYPAGDARVRRFSRTTGMVVTFLCAVIFVGGTLALVIPQIIVSVQSLILRLPFYYDAAVALSDRFLAANPERETYVIKIFGSITDSLTSWLQTTVLEQTNQIIAGITSGVFNVIKEIASIIIGFIVAVYILHRKERFSAQCKRLIFGFFKPRRANGIIGSIRFLDKTVGGFFLGKVIESLIVGLISYIFLIIFGMPYAVLIAVLLGLTNLIPFFGSFIGALPSALMILLEDPLKCLIFIIFIIILHVFANNVLCPRVQGETIGLDGFWVLFAILLFGGLFGFWGLLLGVPIFAVIYTAVRNFNTARLREKNYPVLTGEYESISSINPDTGTPVLHDAMMPDKKAEEGKPADKNDRKTKNDDPKND